jgi:hypothetical protein
MFAASHSDRQGWDAQLQETFGTASRDFALDQAGHLANLVGGDPKRPSYRLLVNSILAAVAGLQPKDELTAMLAVQMVATHSLALDLVNRAKRHSELLPFEATGNMAVKLLRTFTMQVEAMEKLRRGGEQTVRVEHVHVHSGGQAVVGNVTHVPNGGGGGHSKINGQSHEANEQTPRAIAVTPGTQMWSENTSRDAVPVEGSAR